MTDARGVCARSATDLSVNAPYVRGWAEAKHAADRLAEQLHTLDLDALFPQLKADVNVFGEGIVRLGTIRPATAQALATLIMTGLTNEVLRRAAAEDDPPTATS
ncbi:hypothetical protein [Streptomyces radicis]|uniref:Uncharacterized protein n=1 Tax=Streptomyces radicis TaxID=1750517 RepID=A0A3A9WIV4_9ACTN|nr:hypothetical protein [Streptomyces radicis]RKN09404.1 hypothetical protein D7319_13190 [Streptomyces radicis]RKN22998.1 hypothetical protein D7318_13335 [Streptomyces radicis]